MSRSVRHEVSKRHDLLRDARAAARSARLHYVEAEEPGLRRIGRPGRFRYVDARGRLVRNGRTLARIRALVIPPAWQDVWISAREDGHIQATGIDACGRKQYRYHADWRKLRDRAKYEDILPFVRALPRLRRRVARDLGRRELTKEKVVALVVRLMEATRARVGNEKYVRANGSYGLTTLRPRHARVRGDELELTFRGKSGKRWRATLRDRLLASAVERCRACGGGPLFQYVTPDGTTRAVSSSDVNAYLYECMGGPFTAKEFRTWAATLEASVELLRCGPCQTRHAAKRNLSGAIEQVASRLGNTVAVCRKSYIDPAVFDCYLCGRLHEALKRELARAKQRRCRGLSPEEVAVSSLLESLR